MHFNLLCLRRLEDIQIKQMPGKFLQAQKNKFRLIMPFVLKLKFSHRFRFKSGKNKHKLWYCGRNRPTRKRIRPSENYLKFMHGLNQV